MDDFNAKTHKKTGLTDKVRNSEINMKEAELQILDFLQNKCGLYPGTCPLAGNSNYMDKRFLEKDMPLLNKFLHFRIIDVTSFKEIV